MRRGITPVVAIALLLGMTVAASGGAYTFISQAQQEAQEDASQGLATEVSIRALRCDDARVEATLKNTGDTSLSDTTLDAYLYRDGTLVTTAEKNVTDADVLQPNGLSTIDLPFVLDPGNRYTVELRFPDSDHPVEDTCQAQVSSLAGYWNMEEKVPGEVRDVARSNHGTFENNEKDGSLTNFGFDTDSGWVDGRHGVHAAELDGTDDRVDISHVGRLSIGKSDFTVSMWLSLDEYDYPGFWGSLHPVNADGNPDNGTLQLGVPHDSDLKIQLGNSTTSVDDYVSFSSPLPTEEWWHLAVTFDRNGSATVYRGGETVGSLDISSTASIPIENSHDIYLGKMQGMWNYLNGTIDDVRIYHRSLSGSEITALYDGADVNRSGLVGEWTFDEGNGTTAHDTSKWADGKVGEYALAFDGVDDNVSIPDAATLDPTDQLTLSAWINPDSVGESNNGRILSKFASADIFMSNPPAPLEVCVQVSGWTQPCSSGSIPLDTWTHVAVAFPNATYANIYIDGELDTEGATARALQQAGPKAIGDRGDASGRHFNGTIDDVRIYDTALSTGQVSALYNATK